MELFLAHSRSWAQIGKGLLMGLIVSGFPFLSWHVLLKYGLPFLGGAKSKKYLVRLILIVLVKAVGLIALMIVIYLGRFFLNLAFLGSLIGFPLILALVYGMFFRKPSQTSLTGLPSQEGSKVLNISQR